MGLPEPKDWIRVHKAADDARAEWRARRIELRNQYRGSANLHRPRINKVYMTERNFEAVLASERIEALLTAVNPQDHLRARIGTEVLNAQLRGSDAAWQRNRAMVRARLEGISFLQCHWYTPFTPSLDAQGQPTVGSPGRGTPDEDRQLEALAEVFGMEDEIGHARSWVEMIAGADILTPAGFRGWERLPWITRRHWMTRGEVERLQEAVVFRAGPIRYERGTMASGDEELPFLLRSDATPDTRYAVTAQGGEVGHAVTPQAEDDHENPDELLEVCETYYRPARTVLHWIPGTDFYLTTKKVTHALQRPRYEPMLFTDDSMNQWPIPDAAHYLALQEIHNELIAAIVDAAQRAKTIFAYDPSQVVDKKQLEAVASAHPHQFVGLPPGSFQATPVGAFPPDVFQLIALLDQGILQIGGNTQALTGVPSTPSITATEQRSHDAGFGGRARHAARFVTRTDLGVARRIFSQCQRWMPGASLVPLVGDDAWEWELWADQLSKIDASLETAGLARGPQHRSLRVSNTTLAFDYLLKITVGAASEVQNALEKREIQHVLNLTAPLIMGGALQNPPMRALLRLVFERHGLDARTILDAAPMGMLGMPGGPMNGAPQPVGRGAAMSGDFERRTGQPTGSGNGPGQDRQRP